VTTFALDNVEQLQDVTKYRAWTTWLRDTIVASGWVQTSDTGQMDPATVAFPASSTFSLPMLFRMNDALQATFPVIMKIEPGQGAAAGSTTARIAVGSTTNGAGVFTGNSIGPGTNLTGSNPAGLNKLHRASGASNRFTCALWAQQYGVSAVAGCAFWNVERTHNADGSDNADGAMFIQKLTGGPAATTWSHNVLMPPGVTQLTTGVAASPIGTLDVTELATSVRGTTAAAFPVYPSSSRPTLAALNLLSTIDLDFATLVPVSITHYGAARVYLPMGKWSVSGMSRHLASSVTDASTALMRWE
jgi:hypothetical protein